MVNTIFDYVKAKEVAKYYTEIKKVDEELPYLGAELFPEKKQINLDITWIKGSKGLPTALKPSAYDSKATYRDRRGFEKLNQSIPFFKEAQMINEQLKKDFTSAIARGDEASNMVLESIFSDSAELIESAAVTREIFRMSLLSKGKIDITVAGIPQFFDYGFDESFNMNTLIGTDKWSDTVNSDPIADIDEMIKKAKTRVGGTPKKAVCNPTTFGYLVNNAKIRSILLNEQKIYDITDDIIKKYIENRFKIKIAIYEKHYNAGTLTAPEAKYYFPDDVFTLLPEGSIGTGWFATTPEEDDLLNKSVASSLDVAIVDKAVAVTTAQRIDPVNVETKVTMSYLPSFEMADYIFILNV